MLDDLAACSESEIVARRTTTLTRLVLLLLQFVRGRRNRDPVDFTARWRQLWRSLAVDPLARRAVFALFSYLASQLEAPAERLRAAADLLEDEPHMGKTIAVQIREHELVRILLTQLQKRFGAVPAALEQRVRDADEADLMRWIDRWFTATTIDEILA